MKPDIIVTWPRSCDYPLWRQMIRDNRTLFNEIIIVFMETNQGFNYRDFVRQSMFEDHCLFVESPTILPGQDWRNVAVNAGLQQSLHSEWLWFTEQDFFPFPGYFDGVKEASEAGHKVIATYDGERLHPCSIFMKREILNTTRKDFGIVPNISDHFGLIQQDLELLEKEAGLQIALIPHEYYKHMAGLSHNMSLLERGEAPNHKLEDFIDYIKACRQVTVPLHENFIQLVEKYFV